MCLPMAPELLLRENGDFGRSPIYRQLSDTHYVSLRGASDVKHKGGREINAEYHRQRGAKEPRNAGPLLRIHHLSRK
jgi:hypothetical protein